MSETPKKTAQIEATGFDDGQTMVGFNLHLTGGLQAHMAEKGFVIKPMLAENRVCMTGPFSLPQMAKIASNIGVTLLGIDQISDAKTPLPCRTWQPFRSSPRDIPAADLWSNISANADHLGEELASAIARRISFSFHAVGIRIRDASENFHRQLLAVTPTAKHEPQRFKNIQLFDIRLALHSILSELASARDYLAYWFARDLGAPDNVDALNRLKRWIDKNGGSSSLPAELSEYLRAYDETSPDPWVEQITHFRNLHLHREPIGSGGVEDCLRYEVIEYGGRHFPRLSYLVSENERYFAGQDYLRSFFELYVKISKFAKRVAHASAISADYPKITLPSPEV